MAKETFTSAEELRLLLAEILSVRDQHRKKISGGQFFAAKFGYEETTANGYRAFLRIVSLCDRLSADVASLDLADKHKSRIQADTEKITEKVIGIGPIHSVDTWQGNIPHQFPETLSYVEMALAGRVNYQDLSEEADHLIGELEELRKSVIASNLPPEFQAEISKMLSNIDLALRNLRIWGADGLNEAIKILCGEIAIQAATDPDIKSKPVWTRITGFLSGVLKVVSLSRRLTDETELLIDNVPDIAEKLQNLGG